METEVFSSREVCDNLLQALANFNQWLKLVNSCRHFSQYLSQNFQQPPYKNNLYPKYSNCLSFSYPLPHLVISTFLSFVCFIHLWFQRCEYVICDIQVWVLNMCPKVEYITYYIASISLLITFRCVYEYEYLRLYVVMLSLTFSNLSNSKTS